MDEAERAAVDGHLYERPYYRIAPYLVGIACADIYMATKDTVKNLRATWWKVRERKQRETDKQTDRQTNRWTDRQSD